MNDNIPDLLAAYESNKKIIDKEKKSLAPGWEALKGTSINLEEIEKTLKEIFYNREQQQNREIVIMQYCKTAGGPIYKRNIEDFCHDPECPGCASFHKMLKKESSKFSTELFTKD
jgi:hypothetical protein